MPVQSATTDGDRLARRRSGRISGVSPCSSASSLCSVARVLASGVASASSVGGLAASSRSCRRLDRRLRPARQSRFEFARPARLGLAAASLASQLLAMPLARRCHAERCSRPMMPSSVSSASMRRAAVLDLGRRGVLADGDPGAGGVEQARPPCRAAGAPGCSGARGLHRGLERLVEDAGRRGASRACERMPRSMSSALVLVGSSTLHDLEAAGQRGVLLDSTSCTRPRWWRRWCAACRGRARA